jgi:hypothetical protein
VWTVSGGLLTINAAGVADFTITSTGPLLLELANTISTLQVVPVPYHYLLGLLGVEEVPPDWEIVRGLGNCKFADHRIAMANKIGATALTRYSDALRLVPVGDARALKAIDDFELIADNFSAWAQ